MSPKRPAPVETISCQVCIDEIPGSVARHGEANEYVYYYCGVDCYSKWQSQQSEQSPPTPSHRR